VAEKSTKIDGRKLSHGTLEGLRIRAVQAVQGGQHPEDVVRNQIATTDSAAPSTATNRFKANHQW
jgi:hypothetical protein